MSRRQVGNADHMPTIEIQPLTMFEEVYGQHQTEGNGSTGIQEQKKVASLRESSVSEDT